MRELLGDDPELLALAEVIASLRPEEIHGASGQRRRRRFLIGRVLFAFGGRQRRSNMQ